MDSRPGQTEPTGLPSVFPVWWMMVVLLAVIATALVMRLDEDLSRSSVLAQETERGASLLEAAERGRLGATGIHAFSGQLDRTTYGIYMVDVDTATIWCYALERNLYDGQFKMKLVAARSWLNDSQLEEYNVSDPTPGAVGEMLRQMYSQHGPAAGSDDDVLTLPATTDSEDDDAAK